MSRNSLYVIILCCFIYGCYPGSIEDSGSVISITPVKRNVEVNASEIFDVFEYIPLQTNEHLLGSIEKLVLLGGRFYIYDGLTRSVFCFNRDGSFRFQYSSIGRGPGEYLSVDAFLVSQQFLYIVNSNKNVIQLDLDGNFISERRFPFYISDGEMITSDKFAFYSGFERNLNAKREKVPMNLMIMDTTFRLLESRLPFEENMSADKVIGKARNFSRNNDQILFFLPLSDKIYRLNSEGVTEAYTIDFGPTQKDFQKKMLAEPGVQNMTRYIQNEGYCDILDVVETSSFLYLVYKQFDYFHFVFYDKTFKKIRDFSKKIEGGIAPIPYKNDIDGVPYYPFLSASGDTVVSYVDAYLLREYRGTSPSLRKLVSQLSDDDNPVIVLLKLK